ncbi:MAG: PDZ domain-containing protein [Bacteroidetes bacterium]|nr:PDZ domain-containing protein [Bacteroidota bacterium]
MYLNKMRSKTAKILLSFLFLISFYRISFSQSTGFEVLKNLEIMDQIFEHLELYYVDNPETGKVSKAAIDAMLKDLDPYTVYYHESNIEDYRLLTTGQYGGVGAQIIRMGDYVVISEVFEGNPAQKSGLIPGDKVLSIEGKSMLKKSTDEVSTAMKGPKGTSITMEIDRPNQGKKTLNLTRDEIKLPDVPYSGIIKDKVGYIKLNSFTQTSHSDVLKAFKNLKSQGMEQLILDLRGNGGGLLIEAVKIVNMFVPKNQTVVSTKGRVQEENKVYKALDNPEDLEIPLVVLIDEGSASASEVVSGSLQDLDRAVIVGETSFGKGLVQRTYDLKYGSKVKLTIAKYYTPSGRCVQRLEYYDKTNGEKPSEVADSLLKTFKTSNGREVIDGRGIEPDEKAGRESMSKFSKALIQNHIIFNFATEYRQKNLEIESAEKFKLSDQDLIDFKQYMLSQEFIFLTSAEEQLKKLKEISEKEGGFEKITDDYDKLLSKLSFTKDENFDKSKDEIKILLEDEIVSRYYFQNGRILNGFNSDKSILKSIEILQNLAQYNTILNK